MPQALPYIAAAIAKSLGATLLVQTLTAVVTSMLVANHMRKSADAKARAQAATDFRNRNITLRGGVNPRAYALGTVRVGVNIMHGEFVGPNEEYLDVVGAMTHGEIGEVVGVYFNDEFVAAADITGTVPTTGKFALANANAPRLSNQQTLAAATTMTLPYAPRNVASVVAVLMPGGDSPQEQLTVTGVAGAVITFSGPVTGVVMVDYTSDDASLAPLRIQFAMGSDTQAGTTWSGVSTPKWTADHRLRGVSYARWLMRIDEAVYAAGEPQVSPVVRGPSGVYDPRTSTTLGHSSNPALLAAWLRTRPRADGGHGVPSDWIDWPSVGAAANVCDELITVRKLDGSGYETVKRYECHTVLWLDKSPDDNLRIILDSMAGEFPYSAGKYVCFAGAFRSATVTITDADIAAGESITFAPQNGGAEAPPNTVSARFFNAAQDWNEDAADNVVNAAYVTADGASELLELDLPATTDERQANYLMGVMLERTRPVLMGSVVVTGKGANIALLQTLQFNLEGYSAIAGKTFEVRRRANRWDGTYTLDVMEVRASTYALDADRFTPAEAVTTSNAAYLWNVSSVAGLAAAAATLLQTDGTRINRALLSWTLHDQVYVRESGAIEIRYRRPGNDWIYAAPVQGNQTHTYIEPLDSGSVILVDARARNGIGAVSEWAGVGYFVTGLTGAFEAVAGLAAGGGGGLARIAWTPPVSASYLATELRLGADWASGSFLARVSASVYGWVNATPGSYTVWAKHVDRSGNYSAAAASAAFTVTAPGGGSGNVTYYQDAEPASGMVTGDLWFDTNDGNRQYRYSGSAWVSIQFGTNALASGAVTTQTVNGAITGGIVTWGSGVQTNEPWSATDITCAAGSQLEITAAGIARATVTSGRVSSIWLEVTLSRYSALNEILSTDAYATETLVPVYDPAFPNGSSAQFVFKIQKTLASTSATLYRYKVRLTAKCFDSQGNQVNPGGETAGAGTGSQAQLTGEIALVEQKR